MAPGFLARRPERLRHHAECNLHPPKPANLKRDSISHCGWPLVLHRVPYKYLSESASRSGLYWPHFYGYPASILIYRDLPIKIPNDQKDIVSLVPTHPYRRFLSNKLYVPPFSTHEINNMHAPSVAPKGPIPNQIFTGALAILTFPATSGAYSGSR